MVAAAAAAAVVVAVDAVGVAHPSFEIAEPRKLIPDWLEQTVAGACGRLLVFVAAVRWGIPLALAWLMASTAD